MTVTVVVTVLEENRSRRLGPGFWYTSTIYIHVRGDILMPLASMAEPVRQGVTVARIQCLWRVTLLQLLLGHT
jgi:hypothetical protein